MELENCVRSFADGFIQRDDEPVGIPEARKAASHALDLIKSEAVSGIGEESLSASVKLLIENEKSSLSLLSCVSASCDEAKGYALASHEKEETLAKPVCALVLSAAASVCAFLQADYAVGAIAALAAFQALYMVFSRKGRHKSTAPEKKLNTASSFIPAKLLGTYIINASARLSQSISDICDISQKSVGSAASSASSASAELYQILYEMKNMNEPSYIGEALDLSKRALMKADMEGVEYGAGRETCFDILEGEKNATLRPAIVSRTDGKLIKRGEALIGRRGR